MSSPEIMRKGRAHPLEAWGLAIMLVGLVGFGWVLLGSLGSLERPRALIMLAASMATAIVGALIKLYGVVHAEARDHGINNYCERLPPRQ